MRLREEGGARGLTMPGQPATVSRKMALFKTLFLVIFPKRYSEKVSKLQRAILTALKAIRSLKVSGGWCTCHIPGSIFAIQCTVYSTTARHKT